MMCTAYIDPVAQSCRKTLDDNLAALDSTVMPFLFFLFSKKTALRSRTDQLKTRFLVDAFKTRFQSDTLNAKKTQEAHHKLGLGET